MMEWTQKCVNDDSSRQGLLPQWKAGVEARPREASLCDYFLIDCSRGGVKFFFFWLLFLSLSLSILWWLKSICSINHGSAGRSRVNAPSQSERSRVEKGNTYRTVQVNGMAIFGKASEVRI